VFRCDTAVQSPLPGRQRHKPRSEAVSEAGVAQSAERLTRNEQVRGSIPLPGSKWPLTSPHSWMLRASPLPARRSRPKAAPSHTPPCLATPSAPRPTTPSRAVPRPLLGMGTRSWKSSQAALQPSKRFAHYCSDACRQWLTASPCFKKRRRSLRSPSRGTALLRQRIWRKLASFVNRLWR
jgi:hypothetical protein